MRDDDAPSRAVVAMCAVAFAPAAPLPCARCRASTSASPSSSSSSSSRPRRAAFTCARTPRAPAAGRVPPPASPPPPPPTPTTRPDPSASASLGVRRAAAAVAAVAVSLLGVVGGGGGSLFGARRAVAGPSKTDAPVPAAAAKHLRYDGRQELAGPEKAASLAMTGGAFAALAIWAYRKNRVDDELETIRIKEEVERLEKLKAEFEDVEEDDDALDDDEFMAELNKRIAQDAAAENSDEDEDDGEGDDEDGTDPDADNPDSSGSKASGTATIDRPNTAPESDSGAPQSAADIERLRRMWEADSPGDDKRNLNK